MTQNGFITADVWKGDWGLPSIDIECLHLMSYIKISGFELKVRKTNNPFRSPNGKLPVFRHGKEIFTSFDEIKDFLDSKNIDPDKDLTSKQKGEAVAYLNLLKEKLYPALLYIWWIDQKNHQMLTRAWYCKALPFPLNFYYPNKYLSDAVTTIEALYNTFVDSPDLETKIYADAEKCMTAVSNRLGDSNYMFGSKPCSLDTALYAHLAPLLNAPFPNKVLQNYLNSCTNLRKFVYRISQNYFPSDCREYEDQKKEEAKKKVAESAEDFPHAKRNKILAGVFAVFTMFIYAVSTGIVKGPDSLEDYSHNYDLNEDEGS